MYKHYVFNILLIVMTSFCLGSCGSSSSSTKTSVDTPVDSPVDSPTTDGTIYNISTQAEFDALAGKVFDGGDHVLFQRGSSFNGNLSLKRSDIRPDSIITIGDYGLLAEAKPIINANIAGYGAIEIRDSGGWTIENLEIINYDTAASERYGIYVRAYNSGEHKNFIIRNNYVHHIAGEHDGRENGGVIIRVVGTDTPTWIDGILIENNEISDISGVGVRIKSTWQADEGDYRYLNARGRYAFKNVIARGNRIHDTTYNAMIIASADSPLAEYNIMGPNISTSRTGNTFYFYATDSAVAQYNEAFGNTGDINDKDRAAFDADYGSRNTVFRYNYSHDNNFAFSIMRLYGNGIYIHHNISENEKYAFFNYGFPEDESEISNAFVTNNTFISNQPNMRMFRNWDKERPAADTTFMNNIFVFSAGGATWGSEPTIENGNVFENNIVIGLDDASSNSFTLDPALLDPGNGGTEIDMSLTNILEGAKLCAGSSAIELGQVITFTGDFPDQAYNDPGIDFWRDTITSMNIGAYGGSGIVDTLCD